MEILTSQPCFYMHSVRPWSVTMLPFHWQLLRNFCRHRCSLRIRNVGAECEFVWLFLLFVCLHSIFAPSAYHTFEERCKRPDSFDPVLLALPAIVAPCSPLDYPCNFHCSAIFTRRLVAKCPGALPPGH